MILDNPNDYKLIEFQRSNTKNKKYDAILKNKNTGRFRRIPFGDKRYQQYKDTTGMALYSHLNHLDPKRRALYLKRHKGEEDNLYSSGYFSHFYLW